MKNFEKKVIGTFKFGNKIDITDPCYRRDVWCRLNDVAIHPGEYTCVSWDVDYKDKVGGHRVAVAGIYLGGTIPEESEFAYIGDIGVDAGLAGFFNSPKPDYSDEEWTELCNSVRQGDAWIKPDGFFTTSGFGDGVYGVYARYAKDGVPTAVEIWFIGDEPEDEEGE